MLRPLTREDVVAFWDFMAETVDFRVAGKSDSEDMKALAQVLDTMGVVDQQLFMEQFTTVIPLSGMTAVYIPFEIGVVSPHYDLWGQMVVCVHEANHVLQCRRDGDLSFAWEYVTNPASRAHYEAGGYRCNLELNFRYMGRLLNCDTLAANLEHYGCSKLDQEIAARELFLSLPAIRMGAIVEAATKIAVPKLDLLVAA